MAQIKKFMFLEHTADVKFMAFGKTLGKVFENSALALKETIYEEKVERKKKKKIRVRGGDFENLMYNFLEELLFLLDSESFLISKIKVKMNEEKLELEAELEGDDVRKYEANLSVKAVTYNEMFIKKEKNRWIAQVVLDV